MNILDLKKGDKAWIGVHRAGNGFVSDAEYLLEVEVREITFPMDGDRFYIRVWNGYEIVKDIIGVYGISHAEISASQEDFIDGVFMSAPLKNDVVKSIANREGFQTDVYGETIKVWTWDEDKKQAKVANYRPDRIRLFSCSMPEDIYPTKEACEKANRKMVTIEVTRTYLTEREEGADAEWLLNHPDEYEFQDGDECMTDANYCD